MQYRLIKTDLFLNGKLIPEGEIIELPKEEAETLSEYLEEIKTEEKEVIQKQKKNKSGDSK